MFLLCVYYMPFLYMDKRIIILVFGEGNTVLPVLNLPARFVQISGPLNHCRSNYLLR